jgi:hypothetical protein
MSLWIKNISLLKIWHKPEFDLFKQNLFLLYILFNIKFLINSNTGIIKKDGFIITLVKELISKNLYSFRILNIFLGISFWKLKTFFNLFYSRVENIDLNSF